jgi:hypothetical protein
MLSLWKEPPASYRGCEAIKALQKLRDKKNKSKQQTKTNKIVRVVPQNEPQTTQTYKKTYFRWYLTMLLKQYKYEKYVSTNNANAIRSKSTSQ